MDKVQVESFFDEADPKFTFEFSVPAAKHQKYLNIPPILSSSITCKDCTSNEENQGFYSLHNVLLAHYENESSTSCKTVLEISNSRLTTLPSSQTSTSHGFILTKNGKSFGFYFSDKQTADNWMNALRGICILTNFHEEYKASKLIGKGSFAKVYLVESAATGKQFAVKAFYKASIVADDKSNPKATMLNEIDIMRTLDHDNIIKLHEVFETERSIYLVMELVKGKALESRLTKSSFRKDYSERQIIEMIRSILDALAYMASKGIMHRDLKPDNILIDKAGKIKIVDFGLATYIDLPEYIFKKCGTPGYIAPEVFKYNQKISSTSYNDRCDVFSAGCILFYMLFGNPFFDGSGASEVLRLNREFSDFEALYLLRKEIKNQSSNISKIGLDLLMQLLEYDKKKKRISADQALTHEYFNPNSKGLHRASSFKSPQSSECPSPITIKISPAINSLNSETSEKEGFFPSGNRFAEKDSLYLDVGKPDLNGNTDTLTNASANNSLMMPRSNSNNSSNPNSLSAFAKQSTSPDPETKGQNFGFKATHINRNNHHILKAAIFNNIQKNNETGKGMVKPTLERRHTDNDLSPLADSLLISKQHSNPDGTNSEEVDNLA